MEQKHDVPMRLDHKYEAGKNEFSMATTATNSNEWTGVTVVVSYCIVSYRLMPILNLRST